MINVCCTSRRNDRNLLQPVLYPTWLHVITAAFHTQSAPCLAKCTSLCSFPECPGGAYGWGENAGLFSQ